MGGQNFNFSPKFSANVFFRSQILHLWPNISRQPTVYIQPRAPLPRDHWRLVLGAANCIQSRTRASSLLHWFNLLIVEFGDSWEYCFTRI